MRSEVITESQIQTRLGVSEDSLSTARSHQCHVHRRLSMKSIARTRARILRLTQTIYKLHQITSLQIVTIDRESIVRIHVHGRQDRITIVYNIHLQHRNQHTHATETNAHKTVTNGKRILISHIQSDRNT